MAQVIAQTVKERPPMLIDRVMCAVIMSVLLAATAWFAMVIALPGSEAAAMMRAFPLG